jgi:hypothetical protein
VDVETTGHVLWGCSAAKDIRSIDGLAEVNWNAIVDKNKMKMSIDIIIRDRMGKVVAMLSEPNDYIIALDVAEVKFSSELGFYKVVLKGNSLQIVQVLKKDKSN